MQVRTQFCLAPELECFALHLLPFSPDWERSFSRQILQAPPLN